MKGISVILLVLGLFIAGCTQPPAQAPPAKPPAQTPPAQNGTANPPPSCSEYCQTLPHTQCDGEWKISGTYPNCVCNYECKQAVPPSAPPNQTNQTTTEPPFATPTNQSVQDMLNAGMASAESKFYKENDGQFNQMNYTWFRYPPPQGGIVIGQAPYTDVLFDGDAINTIQAFGYIVFQEKATEIEKAYGVAIFKAKSTPLDSYTGSDAFDIDYFYQQENGLLKDCWVYTRDYNVNLANEWFVTYSFRCERVRDK